MKLPPENLEISILSALAFYAVFGKRLDLYELRENLMTHRQISTDQLMEAVISMPQIENVGGLFGLKKVEYPDMNSDLERSFWRKAMFFTKLAQCIPFIKAIAVCNNLALGTVNENSDIDLFIITSRNRIFLARTLLTFFYHLLGVRRHGSKIPMRLCLSFYISEDGMELEKTALENDIYFYYWFKTLKPIFGYSYFNEFAEQNAWIKKYFGDFKLKDDYLNESLFLRFIQMLKEAILNLGIAQLLETLLGKIHKKRFEKNKTHLTEKSSIVISSTMLKFHNLDRREHFKECWLEILRNKA